MKIKFVAQDNTDDANMEIYWRIVASKLPEGKTGVANEEKDAEDWCQFRDSSDYPMSLMGAYPTGKYFVCPNKVQIFLFPAQMIDDYFCSL